MGRQQNRDIHHTAARHQPRMTLVRSRAMKNLMMKFIKEEDGATMVEYAILVALISIAAIVTIGLVGTAVDDKFDEVETALQ